MARSSTYMVRAGALTGFVSLLRRLGADPARVFERLSLPADYLDRPDGLIPLSTKIQLLDLAAELSGDECFGLALARQQTISTLGVIGALAQQSSTLREAIETCARVIGHHVEGLRIRLSVDGDVASYYCGYPELTDKSRQHNDNTVVNAYSIINFLINQPIKLRAAYLSGPTPSSLAPYMDLFHSPIGFERPENRLIFDRKYLDYPIAGASPALREVIGDFFRKSELGDFQGRLRWMIDQLLPDGPVTLGLVARHMDMAPRTLQDCLHGQGVNFQLLLDQTRIERVCVLIRQGAMNLTEISEVVGYSQLSALTRCFTRVKGMSPNAWRQQELLKTQAS